MNSTLWSADIVTHTKIVAVSLIAAIAFATVGVGASIDSTNIQTTAGTSVVVKAGNAAILSDGDASMIH